MMSERERAIQLRVSRHRRGAPITIIEGDGLGTIITGKTTTGTVATCILRSFTPLSLQLSMN
jgi:hypothetical protein